MVNKVTAVWYMKSRKKTELPQTFCTRMYAKLLRSRRLQVVLLAAFLLYMVYLLKYTEPTSLSNQPLVNVESSVKEFQRVTQDPHIHTNEHYTKNFTVDGRRFNDKGIDGQYQHTLMSSVIHSFSPYTEDRVKEILLDPRHEQRIYANSPAIMWHKEQLICVMRIWLEKEKYADGGMKKPPNDFNDNFLYIQKFDDHMKPVSPGSILGLPTPRQWTVGDGPIEPRLFKIDDENIFVSFNTGVYLENGKAYDGTYIWDYIRHKTLIPTIEGGSPILKTVQANRMPRDKHWTPFIDNGELKMVYNLDPLRVLSCTKNFSCRFSHFDGGQDYQFRQNKDSLRGGTPWILYKYPYYYSIGHSTLFKDPSYDRIYTINIVVYKASPVPRVVYMSGPIQIHDTPMNQVPIVRYNYIRDPFFFPVSLVEEDPDTIVIGGHINDYSSVLIRVRGIRQLLLDVVGDDERQPASMSGPPLGTLHNCTKKFASDLTKNNFLMD